MSVNGLKGNASSGTFNLKKGNLKSDFSNVKLVYWDHENICIKNIGSEIVAKFLDYIKNSSTQFIIKIFCTPKGHSGHVNDEIKLFLQKYDVEIIEHNPNGRKELLDKVITWHLGFDTGRIGNKHAEVYLVTHDGDFLEACQLTTMNNYKVNVLYYTEESTSLKLLKSMDISSYKFSSDFLNNKDVCHSILYSKSLSLIKSCSDSREQLIFQFYDKVFDIDENPDEFTSEQNVLIEYILLFLTHLKDSLLYSLLNVRNHYNGSFFFSENNSNMHYRDMENWPNVVITIINKDEEEFSVTRRTVEGYIHRYIGNYLEDTYSNYFEAWQGKYKMAFKIIEQQNINSENIVLT
jgi:hypothetical protein